MTVSVSTSVAQLARTATVASMALAALALSPLVGHAMAASPAAAPTCDELRGATLAQNAEWRVFRRNHLGGTDHPDAVWACEREKGAAMKAVRIATDECSTGRCVTTTVRGLQGDLLLVATVTDAVDRTTQHSLVDLAARREALVGPKGIDESNQYSPRSWQLAQLTPDGGVVIANADDSVAPRDEPYRTFGHEPAGYWVYDAQGARYTAGPVTMMAASHGMVGRPGAPAQAPGVYIATADGPVSRVIPQGAAALDWTTGPRVERAPRNPRPSYAVTRRTIADAALLESEWAGPIDLIHNTRPSRKPRRWLEANDTGLRIHFVDLAPSGPVSILSANAYGALVRARFADRPGDVRVRFHLNEDNDRPLFDLPASRVPTAPGSSIVTLLSAVAIADGGRLRTWDPKPRTTRVPGIHDLAPAGEDGFFYTDGDGHPWRMQLGSVTDVFGNH
ncbi:MAG: hypothetical protein Q7T55_02205 [Solirubrobacteraceae bacterium]|nr:hypothetical protein [Solirubrobacteraceae bacterium]